MREALAIVAEQGLDSMWKRHTELGKYLWAGLREIGLEPYVTDPADRLITVNTIRVPKDIDAVKLITFAMTKFSLEISAGTMVAQYNQSDPSPSVQDGCRPWHLVSFRCIFWHIACVIIYGQNFGVSSYHDLSVEHLCTLHQC